MSDLRQYFVVMPVVVADEPNACRIEFKVGNQMFRFGPEYCEDREHAEWFVDMAIKALQAVTAASAHEPCELPPKLDSTMPSVWLYLLAAANQLVEKVDQNHGEKEPPLKWNVPWAQVTALRDAVLKAKMLNGEPGPGQPSAWMDSDGFISSTSAGGYDIPLYPHPASADERLRNLRDAHDQIHSAIEDAIAAPSDAARLIILKRATDSYRPATAQPPTSYVDKLESLGRAGLVISICYGMTPKGLRYSVDCLHDETKESFAAPFAANDLGHCLQIVEIEARQHGWLAPTKGEGLCGCTADPCAREAGLPYSGQCMVDKGKR
jgi:hypothetical protein